MTDVKSKKYFSLVFKNVQLVAFSDDKKTGMSLQVIASVDMDDD